MNSSRQLSPNRSPGNALRSIGREYDAKAIVQFAWSLDHPGEASLRAGDFRGDRKTIADPLRELGFWVVRIDEERPSSDGPLGADPERYLAAAARLQGDLDRPSSTTSRLEQDLLRGALGLFREGATDCQLCGAVLPTSLLRAAHIKPRASCSQSERLDLRSVAMRVCVLGCDGLFEYGWISVSGDGEVIASTELKSVPDLARHASTLIGRRAAAWSSTSEQYFRWHRLHRFKDAAGLK